MKSVIWADTPVTLLRSFEMQGMHRRWAGGAAVNVECAGCASKVSMYSAKDIPVGDLPCQCEDGYLIKYLEEAHAP